MIVFSTHTIILVEVSAALGASSGLCFAGVGNIGSRSLNYPLKH